MAHHTSHAPATDEAQAQEARQMWVNFTVGLKYSTIFVLAVVALLAVFFA